MKVEHNMFSLFGSISKYKASNIVMLPALGISNILSDMVLCPVNSCREKLQIRYANLRV